MAAPLKSQVGETAPLKTKSVVLVIEPCAASDAVTTATLTSYQSTRDRVDGLVSAPTVCWVHMPRTGSPTAWVRRPSRVSRGNEPPEFGAGLGIVYGLTLTSLSGINRPALLTCQIATLLSVVAGGPDGSYAERT